jgi:hypothetical protein
VVVPGPSVACWSGLIVVAQRTRAPCEDMFASLFSVGLG